ncbi:MAG: hypothetical protein V4590_06675 [Bacteroidota bacterium]
MSNIKKVIHFVFNKDRDIDSEECFSTDLTSKMLPCWLVAADEHCNSFISCLNSLPQDALITLWIHLDGFEDINNKSIYKGLKFYNERFVQKFGTEIKLRFLTRAQGLKSINTYGKELVEFSNFSKSVQDDSYYYKVSDFIKEDENELPDDEILLSIDISGKNEQVVNKKYHDFLKHGGLNNINSTIRSLKLFLKEIEKSNKSWNHSLFDVQDIDSSCLDFYYWDFPATLFEKYLNLHVAEEGKDNTIFEYFLKADPDVKFEKSNKTWGIKVNFFYAISQRILGEDKEGKIIYSDVEEASRLYVLHEALHQIHKLKQETVDNIGSFPRIVEEVDYQADAFAMITELAFFLFSNKGELDLKKLKGKITNTIKVALQTTFAFNPIDGSLKAIQVRRVNRYMIWFFQLRAIEKIFDDDETQTVKMATEKILKLFSQKPVLEITGPEIFVNKAKDRILYNLEKMIHPQSIGLINGQAIERHGNDGTEAFNLAKLIEGFKKSDFDIIYKYIDSLFYSKNV